MSAKLRKNTIAVQRVWLTGEILGYLEILRDVFKWDDDPKLDAHIEKIKAMKAGDSPA